MPAAVTTYKSLYFMKKFVPPAKATSIGMSTRRQTRFLRIWWNTEAERLSVEGEGYYSTKWPSGIVSTEYPYTRNFTRKDLTDKKEVSSPMPQPFHTAEIDIFKLKVKPTKKYEYKKHESDHAGWHNGIRYSEKIKHN